MLRSPTLFAGRLHSARPRPTLRPLGAVPALLALWRARWRQRRALAELDAHLLRDIGRSRAEALRESRKPFWRA